MITNGKDLPFGQAAAGLPNVADAVIQFFQPVTVGIIESTQVDGRTQTIVAQYICTLGVRLPRNRPLVITKTGERQWNANDIYFLTDVLLQNDDLFLFQTIQYRVMETQTFPEYGFNRYGVVQDYTKLFAVKPVTI